MGNILTCICRKENEANACSYGFNGGINEISTFSTDEPSCSEDNDMPCGSSTPNQCAGYPESLLSTMDVALKDLEKKSHVAENFSLVEAPTEMTKIAATSTSGEEGEGETEAFFREEHVEDEQIITREDVLVNIQKVEEKEGKRKRTLKSKREHRRYV